MFAAITMLSTVSCEDDAWTTNPDYEHIYYVGFYKSFVYSQQLQYRITADGVATWRYFVAENSKSEWEQTGTDGTSSNIPLDLHSQLKYTYDITAYFFVVNNTNSELVAGTDYAVLDEAGNTLSLTDGKYALTWSQLNKERRKNVRIKRLTQKAGVLKVNTLPAKPTVTDDDLVETTRNNITDQYEVRGLSHDWNTQTVTFE